VVYYVTLLSYSSKTELTVSGSFPLSRQWGGDDNTNKDKQSNIKVLTDNGGNSTAATNHPTKPNQNAPTAAVVVEPTDAPSVTPTTTATSSPTYAPTTDGPVLDLPKEFHVCRLNDPPPVFGETPIKVQNATSYLRNVNMTFRYQCAGPIYDNFIQTYQYPMVRKRHREFPNWGTRNTIVPPPPPNDNHNDNSNSNDRHILIVGNSHTRQMISALLCQYGDHILESRDLLPEANYVHAMEYKLSLLQPPPQQQQQQQQTNDNDTTTTTTTTTSILTISVLSNHPCVYSTKWKSNLEFVLGIQDLNTEVDAIVIGTFNKYTAKYEGTVMWSNARTYTEQYPSQEIDAPHNRNGFDLAMLAEVYEGPAIFVSMLGSTDLFSYRHAREQVKNLKKDVTQNRTNTLAIDARHYISNMQRKECGSDQSRKVGTCYTDSSKMEYRNAHRCMGDKGGQPDLVAWDVIEALWELLGGEGA
jgi:hypothetical protein